MGDFYISYLGLAPDLGNPFFTLTNETMIEKFRKCWRNWRGFTRRYGDGYSLGFILVTDRGIRELLVTGPDRDRKLKIVDFSIFLPETIEELKIERWQDVVAYLDLVFAGLAVALSKFEVSETELDKIKQECKREILSLIK